MTVSKRTKREDEWLPFPQVPAPVWATLGAVTHAFGAVLYQQFETRVIAGIDLASAEEWVLRQVSPRSQERKTIRVAVREMIAANVLVKAEGGLLLLYATKTWEDYQRTVAKQSTDGAPKVEQPSNDGAPKVDAPSTNGQQTIGANPPELLAPDLQRERENQRETHTESTGVREREPIEDTLEDPVSFYAAVQLRFRKLHRDAGLGDPSMGGKQVGGFPEQLANTARDLGEEPMALLKRTHAAWVAAKCPGTDQGSPYSAFVARFNRYAVTPQRDVTKGFVRSSSDESFKTSGTNGSEVWGDVEP